MHTIKELVILKENPGIADAPYSTIRELAAELLWLYEEYHAELRKREHP